MAPERKGTQLVRTYRLVAALLAGQQLDRAAVARVLGVRPAAADAHLRALRAAGVPLATERRGGRPWVSLKVGAPMAPASRALAVAACFGASVARLFRGTTYATRLEQARDAVVAGLKHRGAFKDASRKFLFISQAGESALPDRQDVLDDLVDAVLEQRHVELEYTGFGGDKRLVKVAPWSIAIYDHQLYVLAGDEGPTPKPYRLSRIRRHTLLSSTFAYPDRTSYDPDQLFRDSFGIFIHGEAAVEDVVLRFAPRWRTYARSHVWHSTHQVVTDGAEGVVVRLRVRICRELVSFVLGFGSEVEVLAPVRLRTAIVAEAEALVRIYRVAEASTDHTARRQKATQPGRRRRAVAVSRTAIRSRTPRPRTKS